MSGEADPPSPAVARRRFLFLQGPLSPLYRRVGRALQAAGHGVLRVNFCAGDWMHWHGPGTIAFRQPVEAWPRAVADLLDGHRITDLVLHGDTRPYHREAVLAAQDRRIEVHVTELGLLRPGYLTHEPGGLVTLSRFPQDPDAIRAIAASAPAGRPVSRFPGSFALEAWQDVSYHLATLAGVPLFPRHQRHTPLPPLVDYALWLRRLMAAPVRRRRASRKTEAILARGRPFFLLPLQVEGDYQIRMHSPFGSMRRTLGVLLQAFRDTAPASVGLVVKTHPLDNGGIDWQAEIDAALGGSDARQRTELVDGGDFARLAAAARGVVTVNSTAGLDALRLGTPVKVLAPALYDVPGLTHAGDLPGFWTAPQAPDADLVEAFVQALLATTQFPGSIHNRAGLDVACRELAHRLLVPPGGGGWRCEPPPRLAAARASGVPL